MNKYLNYIPILVVLAGCSNMKNEPLLAHEFQIVSFTQGKMTEKNGSWFIYEESQRINYTENGECVFNGHQVACMWHGFILEYDSNGKDVELDCIGFQSVPSDIGNPNEITHRNSHEYKYTIPLSGDENTFINPQYVVGRSGTGEVNSATVCSIDGEPVFKFKRTFIYPAHAVQT